MAYTTGFQYDVFVSYARDDDLVPIVDGKGWVSEFVLRLQGSFGGRLGNDARSLRIFFDRRDMKGYDELERLRAAARASAAFLAVGSPSYADSEWCGEELKAYLETDRKGERLFAIELMPLAEGQYFAEAIAKKHRPSFWEVRKPHSDAPTPLHPNSESYYRQHQTQAAEIAQMLTTFRGALQAGAGIRIGAGQTESTRREKGVVFLAETTDDRDRDHEAVRKYVEQAGYLVVPSADLPGGAEFRKAVANALADPQLKLFIQLLGPLPGKRPSDLPEGPVRAQFDAARAVKVGKMIWRLPGIDLAAVKEQDPDHHGLLIGENVQETSLESFKEAIVKTLAAPPLPPGPNDELIEDLLLVISDEPDLPAAREMMKALAERGWMSIIPEMFGSAENKRKILTKSLTESKYAIFMHGSGDIGWLVGQLANYRRVNAGNEHKDEQVPAIALGPPQPKPQELGIGMKHLEYIDCRDGWKVDPILKLVEGTGR